MADNRTMEELLQDVPNDVIKLIMFSYSLEENARVWYDKEPLNSILNWEDLVNKFVNQFFPPSKTTHLKNEISRFTQRFEETFGEACERFKEMLRACPHHGFTELAQIDTFYNGLNDNDQDSLNVAAGGNLLSKTTREALQIIENRSKVRYSRNRLNVSRMNTTSRDNTSKSDDRIDKLADQISTLVDIFAKKIVTPAPVKAVEESCVTCCGAHAYYNCPNTDSNQPSVCVATGTYNQVAPQKRASNYMAPHGFAPVQNGQNRFNQMQGQGNNFNRGNNFQPFQVLNQGFQNQSFQVPNNPVQQGFSNEFLNYKKVNDQMMRNMQNQINSLREEFKNEIQNTMKTQQTVLMEQQNAFQNNLQNMLSGFFQNQSSTLGTLPSNTIPNPKGEMKAITTLSGVAYDGPLIPTLKKVMEQETEETTDKEQTNFQGNLIQKLREKAMNQMERFFQIFQDLHFDISFANALIMMLKIASRIKSLLTNKDKLFELAKIPLNENYSAMLLKKLPEKLRDPGKFLIPYRSITRPKGVTEDVFVKVGKFHFPTDFVVGDFEADPRVSLILGRSFLRTGRTLIDVYEEEITIQVNDEAVTFNLNQTTRYSSTYDDLSVNRIDIIDVAREEYSQEFLGFSNNSSGGNPTSTFEHIFSDSSHSITPFEGSDFILKEINAYLKDESVLLEIDHSDCDLEEDICLIEKLLNDDSQGPVYQPPVFQTLAYQAPAYQASAPQTQGVSKEDFSSYVKANDAVMRNMQTQGQNMQNQLTNLIDLMTKFVNANTASTSNSGTLPSNTIANPRSDLKAITTRSGVSYDGPQIPPQPSFLPLVVENEPEASNDTVNPTNNENTKDVQPQAVHPKPEKLSEMDRTPLNEHCSAVLLKKLPEKLGDPGKFLIPCDFPGMAECLALADLGASINLMPYSVWKRLSLSYLTPTCMTLELDDRLITSPVGIAEDVYVKESITFNLDQTLRYSANYNDMTAKRIDVIDVACEEYSQEVLGFSDTISSGNPIPFYDPIVSTTSSTLTPFGNSDFLLEEVDAFLVVEDKPTSSEFYQPYFDPQGDILLLEAFLNDDPSPPPYQGNYMPKVRKELKIYEAHSENSSVDEPHVDELKELPPHLEYAFLEDDDKLLVIIAKDLSVEEKTALITILKSTSEPSLGSFLTLRVSTLNFVPIKFSWKRTLSQQSNIREG
nr:hypothetical protein [Tanacetum cinerariifolium]